MTETVDRPDTGEHLRLLPRDQYLNPAVFEREYDRVFSRQWLFVGHRSQLDAPGTYLMEESAYRGVRSRRFVSGPLHGTREAAIRSALATYIDMMEDGPTA
ncbi:MAG TPA: hypothetical protein VF065_10190 [Ilumatobacter sp.]